MSLPLPAQVLSPVSKASDLPGDAPFARRFSDLLDAWRQSPPAVGTAALAGRSPNPQLFRAFKALADVHVKLTRGAISYRWRQLHEADPQLAQSIEEVLVFGDALFSAWGRRTPPEDLKNRYIDVKQRYAKIIKETEVLASPDSQEDDSTLSKMFQFMGLNKAMGLKKDNIPVATSTTGRRRRAASDVIHMVQLPVPSDAPTAAIESDKPERVLTKEEQRVERRLDNLDELLDQAHKESRILLDEAEQDLQGEQAFHKATEWFVLAVERARLSLTSARGPEGSLTDIDNQVLNDLDYALLASSGTTSVILSTTEQWLRLKEALHNKSITFLATHENTFTVIQGHLRAWRDIKIQQEAFDALSQAVDAGRGVMVSASKGVEAPVKQWSGDFVTPETMAALMRSFSAYDESIAKDIAALAQEGPQTGVRVSPWDEWGDTTRKAMIAPLLAALPPVAPSSQAERPTWRSHIASVIAGTEPPLVDSDASSVDDLSDQTLSELLPAVADDSLSVALPSIGTVEPLPPAGPWPLHARRTSWSAVDRRMVESARTTLESALTVEVPLEQLEGRQRSAADTLMRLKSIWSYRPIADQSDWDALQDEPQAWRARVLEHVLEAADDEVLDDKVWARLSQHVPQEVGSPAWIHQMDHWMASRDDLEWASVMRWNDLVLDCLILEQDPEQRAEIMGATDPTDSSSRVRSSLSERLGAFLKNPGLPTEALASWGFIPLLIRYACAVDADHAQEAVTLLEATSSVRQPLDWDGHAVNRWLIDHPTDMSTNTAALFLSERATHLANVGLSDGGPLGRPENYPLPCVRHPLDSLAADQVNSHTSPVIAPATIPPPAIVPSVDLSQRRRRTV